MEFKEKLKKLFGIKKEDKKEIYQMVPTTIDLCLDDEELIVTLGQWMGIYPDAIKSSSNGVTVYTSLDAKDFLKKHRITVKERDQIENRFAILLKMAGYDIEDICVLDQFDSDNLSFKGSFFAYDEEAEFSIGFGSFLDEAPSLRIAHQGVYSIYDYSHAYKGKPDSLRLNTVTKELDDGRKFHRYVSEFTYYGDVYDDDNRVEVEISYPESLSSNDTNPYVDTIKMEEILSSITFPISIGEVCSRISEGLILEATSYPKVSVVIKKKVNDKDVITDEARFKDGKFDKLVITKNGKRISIDKFNSWTLDTPTHTISHISEDEISYGFKSMPIEQFESMPTPQELVCSASQDVEEVRDMALSLFNKKSKSN